jgi:hypothetical protein
MSRINHLITAEGQSIYVGGYNLDSADFAAAVRAFRASSPAIETFAANLYNAANAPFCLGSHLHSDATTARNKATAANYFSTFTMKYDARNRTVTLAGGATGTPAQKRYALFTGSRFRKPTYATAAEAYQNRGDSTDMVVEIGVYGTTVVSLRAV